MTRLPVSVRPLLMRRHHASHQRHLTAVSLCSALKVDEVIAVIRKLPNKQCNTDPIPTPVLKDNVYLLTPFLMELLDRSLSCGVFPTQFKAAFITPLLKKPDLDPSDVKSYRPISNLTVLSKTLE